MPEEKGIEKIRIAYWKYRGQRGFSQYAPILLESELGALIVKAVDMAVLGNQFLSQLKTQTRPGVASSTYIDEIATTLAENGQFLRDNAKETYNEVAELANA